MVVVVLGLLLGGCEGAPSALDPQGPGAARIADLWWIMLALAGGIYVGVLALFFYAAFRRGARAADARAGRGWILLGGVLLPVVVLTVLVVLTIRSMDALSAPAAAGPAVRVIGHDWWWEVAYPEEGVITANEIHIPAGRPVRVSVTSADVIHSFWVPQLHGKIDMIPGHTNAITLQADAPGVYRGQCAEYCGMQHAHMAFLVIAEPPDQFAAWLDGQRRPAAATVAGDAQRGQQVFLSSSCAACHAIRGSGASGSVGPDLTHLADRRTIAAGTLQNTSENLAAWITAPDRFKPGVRMPPSAFDAAELRALVAYLDSLE